MEIGSAAWRNALHEKHHDAQMYRALQGQLDTTPSRFIRGIRAERAAELLQAGAGSLTEVAYAVGFESLSYFGRAFRERFGESAARYVKGRGT